MKSFARYRLLCCLYALAVIACAQAQTNNSTASGLSASSGPSGAASSGTAPGATPEFRGMWVTRFEWPNANGDAPAMKNSIQNIMKTLAAHGFNAVMFQVRGQCETLYPNRFEPWSKLIGGRDPGFDPLAYAIEQAHQNGLELHAYMNPFPCWDKEAPPDNPGHIFNKHADWLCKTKEGKNYFEEYYYLNPGNPEVQAYVRQILMDVVTRYDIDGLHLDRIRYPDQGTSFDAVSQARFEGAGNPAKLKRADWQRAQVTGFVNDLYGQILAVKPKVKLSAAVWGIYDRTKIPGYSRFSSGYHQFYQDSLTWLRMGAMDALVPMIYWDMGGKKPDYDEVYKFFFSHSFGRHIYGGLQAKFEKAEEPILEIEYTRSIGGPGTVPFSFGGIDKKNRWSTYHKIYAQKVPTPDMPWKSRPSMGAIAGKVTDAQGRPVTDAAIRLNGGQDIWLTSGDGVFSILQLTPGQTYSITAEKDGATAQAEGVKAEAGKAVAAELKLNR